MSKNIAVPLFSQRDKKWAKLKLGTGSGTIGDFGCLLTALTMMCKYYGKNVDVAELNKLLIDIEGFANGNLYKWYEGITKIYDDIKITKLVDTPNPVTTEQFNSWKKEIDAGRPVILQVDFYPSTAQPDMHFVLLVGYDEKNYYVADPYYGDISNLTRYGVPKTTVLKYAFHEGKVVLAPIDDCEEKVKELNIKLEKKDEEIDKAKEAEKVAKGDLVTLQRNYDNLKIVSEDYEQKYNTKNQLLIDSEKENTALLKINDRQGTLLSERDTKIRNLLNNQFTVTEALDRLFEAVKNKRW